MAPGRINEDNILHYVGIGSFILLAVLCTGGLAVSARFSISVLAGGILAIGNFYWMQNVLRRVFDLAVGSPRSYTFIRYVLRLGLLGLTLYVLMVYTKIDLIGLLTGLSVLVIDIIAITVLMASVKGGR